MSKVPLWRLHKHIKPGSMVNELRSVGSMPRDPRSYGQDALGQEKDKSTY